MNQVTPESLKRDFMTQTEDYMHAKTEYTFTEDIEESDIAMRAMDQYWRDIHVGLDLYIDLGFLATAKVLQ